MIIDTDLDNLLCVINELIYSRLHEVGGVFNKKITQEELRELKRLVEIIEKNY